MVEEGSFLVPPPLPICKLMYTHDVAITVKLLTPLQPRRNAGNWPAGRSRWSTIQPGARPEAPQLLRGMR
jgi:hypothetical protein